MVAECKISVKAREWDGVFFLFNYIFWVTSDLNGWLVDTTSVFPHRNYELIFR